MVFVTVVESSGVEERVAHPAGGGATRWFDTVLADGPVGAETAGERVVRLLRVGHWPGVAASAAGVESGVVRDTLKQAAQLGARLAEAEALRLRGEDPGDLAELTGAEWRVLEFGRAVTVAKALDEIDRGDAIRRVAMGEAKRRIVTTRYKVGDRQDREPGEDAPGDLVAVERVERVEEIPPDPTAMLKVMERLYPERWAQVDRQETSVSGTVEVRVTDARELVGQIRHRLEEKRARALEATAVEVVDGTDTGV